MKIYITKYALSKGIIEAEGEKSKNFKGLVTLDQQVYGYFNCFEPNDYGLTYKEAVLKAEAMKEKKIKSLKKQIANLEKLDFIEKIDETKEVG